MALFQSRHILFVLAVFDHRYVCILLGVSKWLRRKFSRGGSFSPIDYEVAVLSPPRQMNFLKLEVNVAQMSLKCYQSRWEVGGPCTVLLESQVRGIVSYRLVILEVEFESQGGRASSPTLKKLKSQGLVGSGAQTNNSIWRLVWVGRWTAYLAN